MYMFNSRDTEYKSVFGAVEENTPVKFKISIPRSERCSAAYFTVKNDGGDWESDGMFWAGMCGGDREWWDVTFTPRSEGLYWYYFELDTGNGRKKLCLDKEGKGCFKDEVSAWQLTVYESDFKVPEWFKGGVMYQIFPDRFAVSKNAKRRKREVPPDRILREDWGGTPEYRPDERGKICNNDFFGGDLAGITEKLGYLQSLGVTCIYLNPIFEATSNHRYDTGDYSKIDPLLGRTRDLEKLCSRAAARGISVILDGVFSHTGSNSVYFNKYGRYDSVGAYNSTDSPYYSWYTFQKWNTEYSSWWGIRILPEINEEDPTFMQYICGENGILRRWLRTGIRGWRLDVADELPDKFLDGLRTAVKGEKKDAVIIGEVWEDATNKISYGHRRRFLRGRQLDSVMNYPFANAILYYLRHNDSSYFNESIMSVVENYPPMVLNVLMNHIGTHDTERAITHLAGLDVNGHDREWQANHSLDREQYRIGEQLMKLATMIQYTLPGVPCIYYGDEAGMQGYKDPFNRGCYPWGKENRGLVEHYTALGAFRKKCACLRDGIFVPFDGMQSGVVMYERRGKSDSVICIINRNDYPVELAVPGECIGAESFMEREYCTKRITVPELSGDIIHIRHVR